MILNIEIATTDLVQTLKLFKKALTVGPYGSSIVDNRPDDKFLIDWINVTIGSIVKQGKIIELQQGAEIQKQAIDQDVNLTADTIINALNLNVRIVP